VDDLIGVPVVGQPVVYAAGFVVLLIVVFTGDWGGSLVTVAHEGGHMIMSVLVLRSFRHFTMKDGDTAETAITDDKWGVGDMVQTIAGYLSPPLLGLGGAAVLAGGNAWGVLAAAAFLLLLSFFYARGGLAILVTLLGLAIVVLVLWRGPTQLQVALAAGAVWLLLLGGVRAAWIMGTADKSDAYWMARRTSIPRVVWKFFWITVSLVCLYAGGRLLFVGTAWPAGVWPFDARA
jgi:hypothetical protein